MQTINFISLPPQGQQYLLGRSIFGLGPRMYRKAPEDFAYRRGNRVRNVCLILKSMGPQLTAFAVDKVSLSDSAFAWAIWEDTRVDEVVGLASKSISPGYDRLRKFKCSRHRCLL